MLKLHYKIVFFLFFTTSSHYAQFTDIINSDRPGTSMSAYSVGKYVIQAETGIYGIKESHNALNYSANGFGTELELRYGAFLDQLEFIANLDYQLDQYTSPLDNINRSFFKNIIIGAKYLIYDPFKDYEEKVNIYSWDAKRKFKWRRLIPALTVYAGTNLNVGNPYPFPSEPFLSPKVMLISQNHLSEKEVFVINIIADKIGTSYTNYGYTIAVIRGFNNERWSGFIENKGYIGNYSSDCIFRLGTAYLVHENLQMDASIAKNLKNTPDFIYGSIGISWRFDKFYKEALKREEEKQKEEEEKQKEEEEEGNENENINENENENKDQNENENKDQNENENKDLNENENKDLNENENKDLNENENINENENENKDQNENENKDQNENENKDQNENVNKNENENINRI